MVHGSFKAVKVVFLAQKDNENSQEEYTFELDPDQFDFSLNDGARQDLSLSLTGKVLRGPFWCNSKNGDENGQGSTGKT